MSSTKTRSEPSVASSTDWGDIVRAGRTSKIKASHLERLAIVYVRQSSQHQVFEHRESKARQYLLADYAAQLGWASERVLVIDDDQGSSATSAVERTGFQRLLAEVTLDHVGIVLGLEMSRLSRSDKDWHHLLELCAIFDTLLGDQDGTYDAADPNDRLVLGLKGTMSSMELHTMRSRLEKGRLFKAERGELFQCLPSGYVKLASGGIAFDPDEQVQAVIRLVFAKFVELGTARAVCSYLRQQGIRLGIRPHFGPDRGEVSWCPAKVGTLYGILHHPFYAGAYAYGRSPTDPRRKHLNHSRRARKSVPMNQWKVLKRDCVPAYISWDQYLRNQEQLRQNSTGWEKLGAPRQGEALLGGLVVCGRCGRRMSIAYTSAHRGRYDCGREAALEQVQPCPGMRAKALDRLVEAQVLAALQPAALELSLRAVEDLKSERDRLAKHWNRQQEGTRYESQLAERRYRAVDPENRLVARSLEQQWEKALQEERRLKEEFDRFQQQTPLTISADERERIDALATDIPALWSSPTTTAQDRKAMVRTIVDRVVVNVHENTEHVDVTIRWAGGFVSQHEILRPVREYSQLRDFDRLIQRIRELHEDGISSADIAVQLDQEGFHPPRQASKFSKSVIRQIMSRQGIKGEMPKAIRLEANEWWESGLAKRLGIPQTTLHHWVLRGWVRFRNSPLRGYRILWADDKEFARLSRLRAQTKKQHKGPYASELITPQPQKQQHHKNPR